MKTTSSYTWLLFDADGTLFDYDRAEALALARAFHEVNLAFDEPTAALYRDINRQVWLDFELGRISAEALRVVRFERLFEALAAGAGGAETSLAEIRADDFSRRYLLQLAQAADLLDGALETVETLRERYRLALITNGLSDVQRSRLAMSPLANAFEVLAISEELGVAKPDAGFFEIVLDRSGRPPRAECLIIGDSLSSDILGGLNAGIDTCWLNPAGRPADPNIPATYEIREITELVDLLDGTGAPKA